MLLTKYIFKMMKIFLYFLAFLTFFEISTAYGTAGNSASYESRYIVDMPTAGILKKMDYSIYTGFMNEGNVFVEFNFAPIDWLNVAMAFSGNNIIGNDDPEFQNYPSIHLKARVLNETMKIPAIVLGFSTQGKGLWFSGSERFETFSPGLYMSFSKNYKWDLGSLAFHGGINYSIEPEPDNRSINLWLGLEQSIGKYFALNAEYNAGFDEIIKDNQNKVNLSLRTSLMSGLTVEFQIKNLFNDQSKGGRYRAIYFDIISRL